MSLTRARSLDNTINYFANSLTANTLTANGINIGPYLSAAYAAANAAGSSTFVQAAYNTANVAVGIYTVNFPQNDLGYVGTTTSGLAGDYKPNFSAYDNRIIPNANTILVVDLGPTLT